MEEKIVKVLLNDLDCEAIVLFGCYCTKFAKSM